MSSRDLAVALTILSQRANLLESSREGLWRALVRASCDMVGHENVTMWVAEWCREHKK